MVAVPVQHRDAARNEPLSGFVVPSYGPALEWMRWCIGEVRPELPEALWEGVAGAGKTRAIWEGLLHLAERCPDFRCAVVRRTRVDMTQSTLALLENEVLGATHPLIASKGHRGHWTELRLPNGAEFAFCPLNEPSRLYSTEWHVAWVNECSEVQLGQWETIHRGLRAPGGPGWHLLIGDFNPTFEGWWGYRRIEADKRTGAPAIAKHWFGRAWHNPHYFDPRAQEWTQEGVEYLERLRRTMSGPRLQSLFYGKRVVAEGLVWQSYDQTRHRITATLEGDARGGFDLVVDEWAGTEDERVRLDWFLASIDFGHRAPGCLQVWGFDKAGRAFRVAEVYRAERHIDWWADWAAKLWERFEYRVGAADHDPDNIETLNRRVGKRMGRAGRAVWRPAQKTRSDAKHEMAAIDKVRIRWAQDAAFLVRDAFPAGLDMALVEAGQPACLEDEIPQVVYEPLDEGRPMAEAKQERPWVGSVRHAFDAARYGLGWAEFKDLTPMDRRAKPKRQPDPNGEIAFTRRLEMMERGLDPEGRRRRPYRRRRLR